MPKTTKQLIELRGDLLRTLSNPKCESLTEPVKETISQINSELAERGILPLRKTELLKLMQ